MINDVGAQHVTCYVNVLTWNGTPVCLNFRPNRGNHHYVILLLLRVDVEKLLQKRSAKK